VKIVRKEIPGDILKDSVLAHIAAAYFAVGKRLEQKSQCSATRGFILSTLRGGTVLNQNQIATLLGFDRTVVHRAVKAMAREGLVLECRARAGRAILVQLTAKGKKYRERVIQARKDAERKVRGQMRLEERKKLLRLLKLVATCEL
jgi:DNA-binding MarR family transcriptional regulator